MLRRCRLVPAVLVLILLHSTRSTALPDDFAAKLGFEPSRPGMQLAGWSGGPLQTLSLDSTTVHGGRYAGRIERGTTGPGEFSAFRTEIPAEYAGQKLELRGWLRTAEVTGFAGLWLREDGKSGVVQFDNMQKRALAGTTGWTEYSILLPLDGKTRTITFGALLSGQGKVWVDDLQLLLDGRPIAEAPPAVRAQTAVDTDHEFDAGSRITATELTPQQIANLVLLGKTWGFLKYHHPRVTAGSVNWDYELFRILPGVLAAPDRASARAVLLQWARKIGEPPACEPCAAPPQDAHLLPDLEWIADTKLLGDELALFLQNVHRRRSADRDQYYVSLTSNVGNPAFTNEVNYADQILPDAGFRLLALYRFWNIIEYWFPYRDVIGEDWDRVLSEFTPRLFAANSRDEYTLALLALSGRVHDTHANLSGSRDVRPPRGHCQLPVGTRFVEGKAVITHYTQAEQGPISGLRIGDVIEAMDGKPVKSLVAAWSAYYPASNEPSRLRDIASSLTQGDCIPCRVQGKRLGVDFEMTLNRLQKSELELGKRTTHDLPGETFQILNDEIAYLKLSPVVAAKAADYVRAAAGKRGLVIDIRNYPSEFVVFALGRHLVAKPTEFVRFTIGDLANPGAFTWSKPLSLTPEEPRYTGRIAILVDESTLSQAEYTTMAFRSAPGAVVVGSTTAGADGNVSPIPLPGRVQGAISGIGIFYPDKTPTQRVGIVADLKVQPTLEGIRDGRDEVLEAAMAHLLGRKLTTAETEKLARETR